MTINIKTCVFVPPYLSRPMRSGNKTFHLSGIDLSGCGLGGLRLRIAGGSMIVAPIA